MKLCFFKLNNNLKTLFKWIPNNIEPNKRCTLLHIFQLLLTSFDYNSEVESTDEEICSLESTEDTAYHNGSGTYPDIDDIVYSNSAGTTTLEEGYYKYNNGTRGKGYMHVNEDGEVDNLGNC